MEQQARSEARSSRSKRGAPRGQHGGWRRVALALLAAKLAYLAGVGVAAWAWPEFETERAGRIQQTWFPAGWPPEERGNLERHFATWDAEHYLYLSAAGYRPEARSRAFYPLWPLTIRAGAALFGGNHLIAGLVLANLFSLVGGVLFHRITARRFGEGTAGLALALWVVFPGSLFFQFLYSESLFFLLLMGVWWGLEERRYGPAAVCAGLLPLCRGVGAFAVLPLAWHAFTVAPPGWFRRVWPRKGAALGRSDAPPPDVSDYPVAPEVTRGTGEAASGRSDAPPPDASGYLAASEVTRGRSWRPWLLAGMPVLGWGVYLALMWHWTGNAFAGIEAQRYWGVHAISNLWDLPKFVTGFFTVTTWHGYRGSALDRLGFLLALYAAPVLWWRARDLLPWLLALGVLPAMSGTFTSYLRFESCAFPVFLAGGVFFAGLNRRWPLALFLLLNAGAHGVLLWRFVNYRWAG